ncbi:MAG TPA: glycosyltransferase [Candidatus Hydrogenedentes bacterium]|nr:glycosyltransferase [Candidatus Hydrogenedentota bacterium]
MKICLLNVLHEPFDKRVFQKVARSLTGAGHEVVSICPCEGQPPEAAHGVRFVAISPALSKKQRLLSVIRLARLGKRERADVYVGPEPESWVAALTVKLLTGARVVYDMHEHAPSEFAKFFPAPMQPFITWITRRMMRLFARFTDLIILTRQSFDTEWTGLNTPRALVINTNHLQAPCSEIPDTLREQYAPYPTIIHQGIFGDVRGSYQLLEAMKIAVQEIPELRCILLGEYKWGSEEEYRKAVEAAGLSDHILFLGNVPYDEVPAYIAVARAGLILFQPGLLNHTLAMPHKLFDYMREMRPVIAPDFALEVAHIVKEADCGILVDVTNPPVIAEAIVKLLQDPDEAKRLGENGRRLVETKYNWQADEKRLLEAFLALERR